MRIFAVVLFVAGATVSYAQAPEVPHKLTLAGISLTIRDDARREIQKDVDALTQSPRYYNIKAERARTYFPLIEKIFKEERIPDDLKFLVLQESALIADAVSSSNAVGFWQFKDGTAREMGLRVDERIDERMNIVSASRAAARYFRQSNNYFNNWIHVVQSYQMGIGGARSVIAEDNLGARHLDITAETYWYVKKFIAHCIAFRHAADEKGTLEAQVLMIADARSLKDIARDAALTEEELFTYNKWVRKGEIPGDRAYALVIPKGSVNGDFDKLYLTSAKANEQKPKTAARPAPAIVTVNQLRAVYVDAGESLQTLAQQLHMPTHKLAVYNDVEAGFVSSVRQVVYLERKNRKGPAGEYLARRSETLWSISQQFGVRLRTLEKLNGLSSRQPLQAGTRVALGRMGKNQTETLKPVELDAQEQFDWSIGHD